LDWIDTSTIEWEYEGGVNNDYHPKCNKDFYDTILWTIHNDISETYLKDVEHTIDKRRLWLGVNYDATSWHNDLAEGPNCFFLLYFSDMRLYNEGAVWFRNEENEWRILPYPGLLVAVNCETKFQHRAEQTNKERVIASFAFNL
jgi:hypothetical protein